MWVPMTESAAQLNSKTNSFPSMSAPPGVGADIQVPDQGDGWRVTSRRRGRASQADSAEDPRLLGALLRHHPRKPGSPGCGRDRRPLCSKTSLHHPHPSAPHALPGSRSPASPLPPALCTGAVGMSPMRGSAGHHLAMYLAWTLPS